VKRMTPVITKFVCSMTACAMLLSHVAAAQDQDQAQPAPAAQDAASNDDEGTVAVNLNNVDVDHVVKFLSEIAGKPVVKHKDVKVQMSVYSPGKITPDKAFALIGEALHLEKVAMIQDRDTIRLVPAEMLSDVLVEILPEGETPLTGGIVKAVITVRFADVKEIEELVKPLISKGGSMLAHPASKKIIVTDTANRVQAIKEVVAQLDVLDAEQRQIKVFELKHADPEELAPIVKSVLTILAAQSGAKNNRGQPQPGQPPQQQQQQQGQQPPPPSVLDVVPYKSANWLVVVAPGEIIEAAVALVEDFDREKPKELSMRIVPILYADAEQVGRELAALFEKRPDKRVKETVQISANARSSSLIVLSSEENFQIIERLVAELDVEESVQMTTQSFELQFADADDIAEQMNELYSGSQDTGRSYYWYYPSRREESKTRFVPERRTNSLIAIARPTEMAKIKEIITKLDKPIDAEQVSPRIFRVRYVDATELTEVLNKVFGSGDTTRTGGYYDYFYGGSSAKDKYEIGRLYGKVKFVPETTTNSIIVTTNNNENFKIIAAFIEELDGVSPDASNTLVVKLQYANAKDMADQLNALFAAEGARAPQQQQQQGEEEQQGGYYSWLYGSQRKKEEKRAISNLIGQVRVVPDTRTNALMVTTAVQNFVVIEDLVHKLDVPAPKVQVRVRLIEITTTRARRVGTRFSSDPTVFEPDDLDNGLRSLFGITWEDVYRDGTIRASADIDIGLLIQFLQRRADTRILGEPTLVMNNNQLANLFVGSRIPFITASQSTPEGTLNQSFEYRDAGTTMKITPNINELNKVEMKVELESSQIRPGEVLFGGFIIDSRQFNTQLAVESGDTIVIGGILRQSESEAVRRVPLLGHVPVANLAFRKKDSKFETTELIAFITPTVLRSAEEDAAATRDAADRVYNIQDWHPYTDTLEPIKEQPRGWRKRLGMPEKRR
jgi:type II secretion system protein D